LTLRNAFGVAGFFVFYACMTVLSAAYLYKYFPETKGLSLEEVNELFSDPKEKCDIVAVSSHDLTSTTTGGATTKSKFEAMGIDTGDNNM
jgi:hypothetical protein